MRETTTDIHLHLYVHSGDLDDKVDQVLTLLKDIRKQETTIMANLDKLTAQVTANTDTEQSAIVLLNGLAAQLAAVANDPVAVQALADKLKGSADSLAAAIVANTPAAA